ncbi:MAG: TonB-dependent receptor, partial [Gammaproteobacteria bacterium]|nr:TonB-dependent receptor [Gammaproteobacteria bacterium]
AALFFSDHNDLQLIQFSPQDPTLTFVNVDAESTGFELEALWRPAALPSLSLELKYSWLDAEYTDGEVLNLLNKTQGDPTLVELTNTDFPGSTLVGYVAPIEQVLPLVDEAIAADAAVVTPHSVDSNGIPIFFSRGYLESAGVATSNGGLTDLDGKNMPNSPPHSIRLGAAYTWLLAPGAFTLRYDYYWQDSSYAREFNMPGDEINRWSQHNASAIFESANGRWTIRAWVRNLTDEEIVTAHWVANDVDGNFRNYLMAEPRIYGASMRYNFGNL